MPTGTGKTVSLISLVTSYIAANKEKVKKIIYCTRTVVEMEKTIREVKVVLEARKKEYPEENLDFLAVGLR